MIARREEGAPEAAHHKEKEKEHEPKEHVENKEQHRGSVAAGRHEGSADSVAVLVLALCLEVGRVLDAAIGFGAITGLGVGVEECPGTLAYGSRASCANYGLVAGDPTGISLHLHGVSW